MKLTLTRMVTVNLLLLLLCWGRAGASTSTVTGTVKGPDGSLFNGTLVLTLSRPAQDSTTSQVVIPQPVPIVVNNGAVTSTGVVSNDSLNPLQTVYLAQFFDPSGNLVMQNAYYLTAGAYDIGTAIPTSITTNNVSYITPVSLSGNNTWTGTNTFSQKIISTVTTGTAPLQVASTTPVANLGASHIFGDNAPIATTTAPVALGKNDKLCWRNSDNTFDNCLFWVAGINSATDYLEFTTQSGAFGNLVAANYKLYATNSQAALTVNNSNTENNVTSFGLNANELHSIDIIRIHADGVLTNTSGGNVTYTFRVRIDQPGGAILCASAGVVVATGATGVPWHIDCTFGVAATGGAGTVTPWGNYTVNATTGDISNATAVTVDTTIVHNPALTAQMSVANANASYSWRQWYAERLGSR